MIVETTAAALALWDRSMLMLSALTGTAPPSEPRRAGQPPPMLPLPWLEKQSNQSKTPTT